MATQDDQKMLDEVHDDTHNEHHTVGEIVKDSVKGTDEPVARRHPMVPWDLVWYTYPLVLIAALILMLLYFAFTSPAEQL